MRAEHARHARHLRARSLVVVIVAVLGIAIVAAPGAGATTATTNQADDALDTALERFVASPGGPPSVVVVVQRGDVSALHAEGVADVATGARPTIDDHMRLASVSKAVTGAVAVSAVGDERLGLDDTVGEWRPELPKAWSKVTLAQLMAHTSGIPDFSQTKEFGAAVTSSLLVAPPPVDLLTFVADEPLLFMPGSKYKYSNSDNIIVALMVEAATGHPFAQELETRVSAPLKLTRTSLPTGVTLPSPSIHGYDIETPEAPEDVSELFAAGWAWTSGGIVSSPSDANRFIRGYAAGATTNGATHTAQFRFRPGSSEPPGPGKNAAGLSIFRYKTSCGTVYGHTGNTPGYVQFIAATLDGSRSVTVSTNAQITPNTDAGRFAQLRRIYRLAVCAALA